MAASAALRMGTTTNRWREASLLAQITLALYFQAMNWVSLGAWNYQPGFEPLARQAADGRLAVADVAYASAFLLPVALYLLAAWRRWSWLMWIGLVGYSVWLALEIVGWWIPYAFGASAEWMATYQRVFSQSTQLLPSFGRHLAPDGLHIVLDLLVAIVVAMIAIDRVRSVATWARMRR